MAAETRLPPGAGRWARLGGWIDARLPVSRFYQSQLLDYYAPKNFNIWYFFGSLALVVLVMQLVTGIFLTMFYKPDGVIDSEGFSGAFRSVEYIMREVSGGSLIRYLHSTGASAFFIVVYLHMFRGLLYGSYKKPRELLWIVGVMVYLALMAEAFFGYVLPWGNMSYWGAQVIVNLFGAIPGIGPDLIEWIRGDYSIADATLNRFFALHVVAVPLILLGLVFVHLWALRTVGSNNPDGIEIKEKRGADGKPLDGIPFHPYYTVKDLYGVGVFGVVFASVVFFMPTFGGLFLEAPNFEPANPLSTPEHIAPVWYFTPYYAILRAVPDKLTGAGLMGLAVLAFAFLPWLDRSPIKSVRYRSKVWLYALMAFAVAFIGLGYLGLKPAEGNYVLMARILGVVYFLFFLGMPFYTRGERGRPVPERLTYHG
ncbi:MAG TPA: cytochrome bc complex cytochrome b subunit [Steroidobacteraceae bacterium]|nr:cytochrome bc complex cytochrome b subunit [Steroidobacteraceae bacterium]